MLRWIKRKILIYIVNREVKKSMKPLIELINLVLSKLPGDGYKTKFGVWASMIILGINELHTYINQPQVQEFTSFLIDKIPDLAAPLAFSVAAIGYAHKLTKGIVVKKK